MSKDISSASDLGSELPKNTAGDGNREITDDEIDDYISDPATIPDHETAIIVMEQLDHEIAQIQTRLDAKAVQYNGRHMSAEDQDWVRRASYAAAMRANERRRVYMRDKELRGVKGPSHKSSKTPEEHAKKVHANLEKQARLHLEAKERSENRRLKQDALFLELLKERNRKEELRINGFKLRLSERMKKAMAEAPNLDEIVRLIETTS